MQFKCNSCKHIFKADNNEDVVCPKCQSEKVSPYVSPMKIVLPLVGVLVIALGTFFVIKATTGAGEDNNIAQEESNQVTESPAPIEETTKVQSEEAFVPDEDLVIPEPVVVNVTVPIYANGKYSFQASCEHVEKGVEIVYVLTDSFGQREIQVSDNGKFENIVPSEDGMYKVIVKNKVTKEKLADKIVEGFVKHKTVALVEKISKEELQSLINAQSSKLMGHMTGIADHVILKFSNLDAGEKKPKIFADIFAKITMGDWESVTVTNVGYDEQNCINVVTMKVKHAF